MLLLPLAGALSCRVPPTEYTESPEEEPLNPTAFLDRFGGCVLEHAEESHGEAWCDASDEDLSRWHFVGRRPGSLSKLHIRAVIEQHLGGVRRCYENALQVWHHLAGRSEYQFAIEPDGHVRSVLLAEDNVGSDPLAAQRGKG